MQEGYLDYKEYIESYNKENPKKDKYKQNKKKIKHSFSFKDALSEEDLEKLNNIK